MDPFQYENELIHKYLSDFTVREGVLLTIAGLFTLFPLSSNLGMPPVYLVKWVLPFLIASIAAYICSSKRINVLPSMNSSLTSFTVNGFLKNRYLGALCFHRWTDSLLVMYFSTFTISYYFHFMFGPPDFTMSLLITFISIFIGAVRYHFSSKLDGGREEIGVLATGGHIEEYLPGSEGFNLEK